MLFEKVHIDGPTVRAERAARSEAEKLRTRMLAEADAFRTARFTHTVGSLLTSG